MGVYTFSQAGSLGAPRSLYKSMRATAGPLNTLLEYVVIAGGGAGGYDGADPNGNGGGGAGGYRSSVVGELSGASSTAESRFSLALDTNYSVTIGAGGSGVVTPGNDGFDSIFATITSIKGGGAGRYNSAPGGNGGSGGGGGATSGAAGLGTALQGTNGAAGASGAGGNGGGAAIAATYTNGGNGLASSITGTSVTRAGGGAGNGPTRTGTPGTGGGGPGTGTSAARAGAVNTGSGGGAGLAGTSSGNGGSGIVILRYSNLLNITIGAGLTATTNTVGSSKITTITAGTGNVSWAA
jgi:hypothetical protein